MMPVKPSSLRDWAQLVRIPNTLTAVADIVAGAAMVAGSSATWGWVSMLALVSICLYWSGMVLNDLCDLEEDRKLNRKRPLADGRISVASAKRFCLVLCLIGMGLAMFVAKGTGTSVPWIAALVVLSLIVAYDQILKTTPLAPWLMGMCRGSNMILGASLAGWEIFRFDLYPHLWMMATGHVFYVTGFTLAARREAQVSQRGWLVVGWFTCFIGVILFGISPQFAPQNFPQYLDRWIWFPVLIGLLVLPLARRAWTAIHSLQPIQVQLSIRQAIWTIIFLDAAVVLQFAGSIPGTVVCLMLLPTAAMGRVFAST